MGIVKKRNKRYSKDVNSINTSLVNSTFIFPTVKLRNQKLKHIDFIRKKCYNIKNSIKWW